MTRIIAVANHKGGVGKTTTTFNLAGYYAAQGKRVLAVDLDPQASLTKLFGINPRTATPSLTELLIDEEGSIDPKSAVHETRIAGAFLIPANSQLANAEKHLVNRISRELVLAHVLRPLAQGFDVAILDCPPALDLLNTNGLAAAHDLIIPLQSSMLAFHALPDFLRTVQKIQQINPELMLKGVVLTMHQAHTSHSQTVLAEAQKQFPDKVFQALIPLSVTAKDSVAALKPIFSYDPRSSVAEAYRSLAEEIAHHV